MLSSGRAAPGAYRGIAHGCQEIMRTEGLKGFYRGLLPSLIGVSHGAIQFVAYEQLKIRRSKMLTEQGDAMGELTNFDYLTLSAVSKIFAGSITYPYQVVRSRLQTYDAERTYRGTVDVVRQVWMREGFIGFYKGYILTPLPSSLHLLVLTSMQTCAKCGESASKHLRYISRLREHEILPT